MILHMLIVMIAGWLQRHQQQVISYLIEENRVLKAHLGGRRLRLTDPERRVASPRLADNSSGPFLSRPRGLDQPVARSRIGFSASHGVSLPACRHTDPALLDDPLPGSSATALGGAATAAPGRAAPLGATRRGLSIPLPSPVYTAATPSLRHGRS
jgi:hypothetical protein